jgi:hypothetical protein
MKAAPPCFPFPEHRHVDLRNLRSKGSATVVKGWWPRAAKPWDGARYDMAGRVVK